jgi:AcrR family transcriptional regulator
MPRLRAEISGKRMRALIEAALGVFCRQGFERSQVADVAKAMGVAVGTVYLYVESKEALFDLVVRHTSEESPAWLDALEVPVRTPAPGSTVEYLRSVFGRENQWPVLAEALARESADDPQRELEGILREQYQLMRRYRMGLLLLTRSALEFPGLSEVFVLGLRQKLLTQLVRYIDSRVIAGQLRPPKNSFASAAVITQTIAWANLQRPFDPGLQTLSEEEVEEAAIETLMHGLLLP